MKNEGGVRTALAFLDAGELCAEKQGRNYVIISLDFVRS